MIINQCNYKISKGTAGNKSNAELVHVEPMVFLCCKKQFQKSCKKSLNDTENESKVICFTELGSRE